MIHGIRVGFGYDVHKLVEGRSLVLGGVSIPHDKGLLGHSDADVMLHAICDAILGAAALGDIGRTFPDTDERYKGISSLLLLERCTDMVDSAGFWIVNIDVTLVAQRPKIAPYIEAMESNIAKACRLERNAVNVKATTTEGLGFTGTGEGMAAYAVAALAPLQP